MKILSLAPCRLSLFGGGTDVEPYVSTYGGLCLNMAINLRQHLILYSDENLWDIPHNEFPPLANPEFYYQALKEFGVNGLHHTKIKSEFDGILESGLGSSAAAMVALVGAINKRLDLKMTRSEIAYRAWDIEVHRLNLFGGKQDQYAAALGGVNIMEFGKKVTITSLSRNLIEPLLPFLVLFYLGKNRQSAVIQEGFKNPTAEQVNALHQIKKIAEKAIFSLHQKDFKEIGKLLDTTWYYKKLSNKGVSNEEIDRVYNEGIKAGAWGGKILGAGGGGHIFFVCPLEKREKLVNKMAELGVHEVDFSICYNGLETRKL